MDANCVDRPLALVVCPPCALSAALVLDLVGRGFEVWFPHDLLGQALQDGGGVGEAMVRSWRHLRPVDATVSSTAGRAALLLAAAHTGRPPAVVVLAVDHDVRQGPWLPDATALAALTLLSSRAGRGRLLVVLPTAPRRWARHARVGAGRWGVSVTLMAARRSRPRAADSMGGPGSAVDRAADAREHAHAAVEALLTDKRRAPVQRRWRPRPVFRTRADT